MFATDIDGDSAAERAHVPESRFGMWFLNTEIWRRHVLLRALIELDRLIPERRPSYGVIVDVGCGFGHAFKLLHRRFAPERMVGGPQPPQGQPQAQPATAGPGQPGPRV